MSRFDKANWRGPVPNMNAGQMVRPFQGLVLHIEQGTEIGTDGWFHNPASGVSAHFGNPKVGTLDQWVDTDDLAWAQMAGNPNWISLENEGQPGDSLTADQLEHAALLLAWLNLTEGVSMSIADTPSDSGLGYHAMGGVPWGNHPQCPGQPIIDQRADIIAAAQHLVSAPSISGLSPSAGPDGTTVVITGSGFTFAQSVGFGGVSVSQMQVDSDSQITVVAPPGSGAVDVEVVTLVGTSAQTVDDLFTYTSPVPVVTGLSPASGPEAGGNAVVIFGSGFNGASDVGFGVTSAAQLSVDSDTQITVVAPSGTGGVDVTVVSPGGTSVPDINSQYQYVATPVPDVTGLSATSGDEAGGESLTVFGGGLAGASDVSFGGTSATILSVSDSAIDVTTPPGTGVVDVVVTTPGGTSVATPADEFEYVAP
jgi:hypothetical protein